ncbi:MAG: Lrp/AsnC family transcriptional regulator [Rhodoferax sp.]|jgi:Lrp/AsnC family transcriptional regulator, leucine-responsive regulatory protein|nr:Lrp/AsnC family transcriptional regulator [Rhodoferax sp.]MBK9235750.1 Lrp/AsnC family transcriptional regulator [Rhodoferax sp.]
MSCAPGLTEVEMVILELLQRDARLSSADLAAKLNLSVTPTWRRVKKLEESGLIQGYHAQIDPKELGFGIESFLMVNVHAHDERSNQLFEAAVGAIDDVVSCQMVSGAGDYLLRVVSRDMESYADFISRVAGALPGVREMRSTFVLKTIKPFAGLPIRKAIAN